MMMMTTTDEAPIDDSQLSAHFDKNMTKPKLNNIFKKIEKKYKRYQNKETDFSNLINFETVFPEEGEATKLDLVHPVTQEKLVAYKFNEPEGLIVIKNYFSLEQQVEIAHEAINEYIFDPFRTNLFIYPDYSPYPTEYLNEIAREDEDLQSGNKNNETNEHEFCPGAPYNYKHFITLSDKYNFNSKLRWANLGYQYNWTDRCYYPEMHRNHQETLPTILNEAAMELIELLSMQPYKPQSVIVNFYNLKSAMGGHLDDGEPDQEHPILSFSIGLEGVFLIGGKSRNEGPVREIGVTGGDVVIMAGESRRRVHGVPRIRENTWDSRWSEEQVQQVIKNLEAKKPHVIEEGKIQNNYQQTYNWLGEHRLNLNFRQVVIGAEKEEDNS